MGENPFVTFSVPVFCGPLLIITQLIEVEVATDTSFIASGINVFSYNLSLCLNSRTARVALYFPADLGHPIHSGGFLTGQHVMAADGAGGALLPA